MKKYNALDVRPYVNPENENDITYFYAGEGADYISIKGTQPNTNDKAHLGMIVNPDDIDFIPVENVIYDKIEDKYYYCPPNLLTPPGPIDDQSDGMNLFFANILAVKEGKLAENDKLADYPSAPPQLIDRNPKENVGNIPEETKAKLIEIHPALIDFGQKKNLSR